MTTIGKSTLFVWKTNNFIRIKTFYYYSYYRNVNNKTRFDIKRSIEDLEEYYFTQKKKRCKTCRGRDKYEWYAATMESAQVTFLLPTTSNKSLKY